MATQTSLPRRQKLEAAIRGLDAQRGMLGNDVVETALEPLRAELVALQTPRQRKLATLLFVDIANHTELVRGLDPEEQMGVIDPAIARLAEKITDYGGRISRFQGDGFKAVFGLPVARESDPVRAARSALSIMAEAAKIAAELTTEKLLAGFTVRIGMATGMIAAGGQTEGADTIKGPAVALAARLEQLAAPSSILVATETYQHLGGLFSCTPMSAVDVKGFSDPVAIYRLGAAREMDFYSDARGLDWMETPLVGREAELRILQKTSLQVQKEKSLREITITGEAGIGKTRLLREFETWSRRKLDPIEIIRCRTMQVNQDSSFALVRGLIENIFRIQGSEQPKLLEEKLEAGLAKILPSQSGIREKAHILGQLAGYDFTESQYLKKIRGDPQQLIDRGQKYLAELISGIAQRGLTLIFLDDIHWADDSSLTFFQQLWLRLPTHRALVLATARPEFDLRHPHWCENLSGHRRLELRRLTQHDGSRLVRAILPAVDEAPEGLEHLIVQSAGGNPFYLEELIKMLIDQGAMDNPELLRSLMDQGGHLLPAPQTLVGVLQARFDALSTQERLVIQAAAIIGRIFWEDTVRSCLESVLDSASPDSQPAPLPFAMEEILSNLKAKRWIEELGESKFENTREYSFKHDLLQEVVYQQVLLEVRRQFHLSAAAWYLDRSQVTSDEFSGLIGDHFYRGGQVEQGLHYWQKAAEAAAAKFANAEAVEYLNRAITHLPKDDRDKHFELLMNREALLDQLGNRELQKEDLDVLSRLVSAEEGGIRLIRVLLRKANFAGTTGDFPTLGKIASTALKKAQREGHFREQAEAYKLSALATYHQSNFSGAQSIFLQALPLARSTDSPALEAELLGYLGMVTKRMGNDEKARDYHIQALQLQEEIGDLRGQGFQESSLGLLARRKGELFVARKHLERALHISKEVGYRYLEAIATKIIGDIEILNGRVVEARQQYYRQLEINTQVQNQLGLCIAHNQLTLVNLIVGKFNSARAHGQQALRISLTIEQPRMQTRALGSLGRIAAFHKKYQRAVELLAEATTLAQEHDIGNWLGQLWYGDALMDVSKWEDAEASYQRALEIGGQVDSVEGESQALAGLARLRLAQNDIEGARGFLENLSEHESMGDFDSFIDLLRIYLTRYQVLAASGSSEAEGMLQTGYTVLQKRANRITDEEMRKGYLENIPWHRKISELTIKKG